MAAIKIKLNQKNIGEHVLRGSGTDAYLMEVAQGVAAKANSMAGTEDGFAATMGERGQNRHRAFVRTVTVEAARAQATDKVLERAMNS